jgi:hypothetical protein
VVELKRNEITGAVEAWKNGKKIGEIVTMGDAITTNVTTIKTENNDHRSYR